MSTEQNVFDKLFAGVIATGVNSGGVHPTRGLPPEKNHVMVSQQKLEELKSSFDQREEVLKRLKEAALLYALVIAVLEPKQVGTETTQRRVTVLLDGKQLEVAYPGDLMVSAGDTVKLTRDSLQIVGIADSTPAKSGGIAVVTGNTDDWTAEVIIDGNSSSVFKGKFPKIAAGDRVVLDTSRNIIIKSIGAPNLNLLSAPSKPVEWSEIIGQDEAIRVLKEAIELPVTHADYFAHYHREPPKGILLWGPPGCGKTFAGRAAATAQARIHGQKIVGSGFMYIRGPEFLSKFVAVAEADIRQAFSTCRAHFKKYSYRAIIFFDEAEAMFSKRGSGISSDIEKTIVPTLLTEMDGFEEGGPIVILATNRQDLLDPAIVRDKRIDRKICIARPGKEVAPIMFRSYLRGVPLVGTSIDKASQIVSEELFSDRYGLYEIPLTPGTDGKKETRRFCLGNLASGAMIASIVEQASGIALERDIAAKAMTGITLQDLKKAVASVYGQNINLGHTDDLELFLDDVKERVLPGIRKLRQAKV